MTCFGYFRDKVSCICTFTVTLPPALFILELIIQGQYRYEKEKQAQKREKRRTKEKGRHGHTSPTTPQPALARVTSKHHLLKEGGRDGASQRHPLEIAHTHHWFVMYHSTLRMDELSNYDSGEAENCSRKLSGDQGEHPEESPGVFYSRVE